MDHTHSPPRKAFVTGGTGSPQETICLLPTTSSNTPTVSADGQRYTVLVSPPPRGSAGSPPGVAAVTADHLRYVQIHNTPTHMPPSRPPKKSAPCVSWRVEPHELHTYSPEIDERSEQTLVVPDNDSAFVDLDNGYAQLGKDAETNAVLPYDHLVHHTRYHEEAGGGSGSFTDFPNSVI